MSISYQTDGVSQPNISEEKIEVWINDILKFYEKELGDICYIFCNDEKIIEINKEYLGHDYYTDIITFDYVEEDNISGDIVISLDTVRSNSEEYKTDYEEELHRVMIHGVLHLCGLDDLTTEDENKMREAENKALEILATY